MNQEIEEIQQHLDVDPNTAPLEETAEPKASPINEPVAEGEIGLSGNTGEVKQTSSLHSDSIISFDMPPQGEAPEQEVTPPESEEEKTGDPISDEMAGLTADSYIGIADYALGIGAGYFVTIKKHHEFYEFDSVIRTIDEFNRENVQRFKLSEEEKLILRPALVEFIKEKSIKYSAKSNLLSVVTGMLMKRVIDGFQFRARIEEFRNEVLDEIRNGRIDDEEADDDFEGNEQNQDQEAAAQNSAESEVIEPEDLDQE